jgi:hypothetical protein
VCQFLFKLPLFLPWFYLINCFFFFGTIWTFFFLGQLWFAFWIVIFFVPKWPKGEFLRSWFCNIQGCISCVLMFMVLHFMHGSLFLLLATIFGLPLSFCDKKEENVWITLIKGVITLIDSQNANVFNNPSLWQSKVCYFKSICQFMFQRTD